MADGGIFRELKRRNVIRVGIAYVLAAWLLLQVADFVLDAIEAPGWILQVFVLAALIGLPAVLAFAWVFELTPEGLKRETEIDRSQPVSGETSRRLDRVIIATLALAVIVLLADRFVNHPAAEPERPAEAPAAQTGTANTELPADRAAAAPVTPADAQPAIAVLPFVNMSADPDNEYFSDGVAEEILNVLARIPELKVSARTSAFTYKGSGATIAQIARELGVNHVLEGSVRKSGNQVRVTAQLIEAETGFHVWSDTYDRELTNIFAIQDEIAQALAGALQVRLLPATGQPNQTGTANLAAYDHYLKGVSWWHERTGESLEKAREQFEEAIALDPAFARAHGYLALTWAVIADYTDRSRDECRENAMSAAQRARELDPRSVEAATALVNAAGRLDRQLAYGREAIALNPGFATAHQWYATMLFNVNDVEGALREYRLAQELDPLSRIISDNLASAFLQVGRLSEAEEVSRRTLSIAPDWPQGRMRWFIIQLLRGDRDQAEQAGRELALLLGRTRDATPVYLDLFFDANRRDAAVAEIASWPLVQWEDPGNPSLIEAYDLALVLAAVGAREQAFTVLESLFRTETIASWGYFRAASLVPEFVCSAEVEALFATAELPPLVKPFPCPN